MPEFTSEAFGLRFTTPDAPTVLEVLAYDSRRMELTGQPALVVLWECAKTLIREWECAALPDFRANLGEVTDARVVRVVEYAGIEVSAWRRSLDGVSKN